MIQFTVNNAPKETSDELNLISVFKELDIDTQGCAVAVDDEIIPRAKWSDFTVKSNMSINIFQAIAGG
ncbi:sulfur carrier protein ThiS [Vibrio mediterranei]|uniref:Thiamine biosynthesis protein ThiS n=1 Tax=Vibrio mediterranei TaxID=689 RepID=A0AAN1FF08_9VIBR|nr:sulfur carrier protein ThiS [Vibrio mediterranei]ASI89387.1 thiamine biosynthesis protein ThiS [Vibrio mediterranei]